MKNNIKQYPWNFKLRIDGIEWYQTQKTINHNEYCYYFKWCILNKQIRNDLTSCGISPISLYRFWYDCPHAQLNLFYICFYWSTPWTAMPDEYK